MSLFFWGKIKRKESNVRERERKRSRNRKGNQSERDSKMRKHRKHIQVIQTRTTVPYKLWLRLKSLPVRVTN